MLAPDLWPVALAIAQYHQASSAQQVRPGKRAPGYTLSPPVEWALCLTLGALGRMGGERALFLLQGTGVCLPLAMCM